MVFYQSSNIALKDHQEGGAVATKDKSGGSAQIKFYTHAFTYTCMFNIAYVHVRVIVHHLSIFCAVVVDVLWFFSLLLR